MPPATPREWALGYHEQARVDVTALQALQGSPMSVVAMLLQMVFEKLSKAALLRRGAITVEQATATHKAATLLVPLLKRRCPGGRALGFQHSGQWLDVLQVVRDLEASQPGGKARTDPVLEYPWEGLDGAIRWPERDLEVVRRLANPKSRVGPLAQSLAIVLAPDLDRLFESRHPLSKPGPNSGLLTLKPKPTKRT